MNQTPPKGIFVSFDGVDGAGKSTQIELLRGWLAERDREVLVARDPGGTKLGESLREVLLHRKEIPLCMTAEMLVYMASRAQLVEEVIRPSIAKGQVVLCDRFLLANVVYQGSAGGLETSDIWATGSIATGGLEPDITFILDLEPEIAMQRIARGLDRLESRGIEYMRRVRAGFQSQKDRLRNQVVVLDALRPIDELHSQVVAAVDKLLQIK